MAGKKQQTHAKRARELAVKERRERKRAKKEESAAEREAGRIAAAERRTEAEGAQEPTEPDWIQ
jgi:hypothetical protein